MSVSSPDDKAVDRATREAATWMVALDDDPADPALHARFQEWLSASPVHAAAWKDTADVAALAARLPPAFESHWKSPPVTDTAPPRAQRWFTRSRLVPAGAAFAAAACLALIVAPSLLLRARADHITTTGELRDVRLGDGSVAALAPETAIAVTFTANARNVRLLKGEAYFDVVPDASRPFQVRAGAVRTTVRGTAFGVRLEDRAATVAVAEGRVQVARGKRVASAEQVDGGQWMRMTWAGEAARGELNPADVAAWRQGQIVARGRTLEDTVAELRRSFTGVIVLSDDLAPERVTGVYNIGTPVAALEAMAGAHGGTVRQLSPWLLVVAKP